MKIKDVNFIPPKFVFNKDYIEAGCPVRYFEFNKHEYYGLVATHREASEIKTSAKSHKDQAFEIYYEAVAGDSLESVLLEGEPNEISKSEALLKFLLAKDTKNEIVGELIEEFETIKNGVVLYVNVVQQWELDSVKPLPKPVPAKGQLSLWEWDGEALAP